MKHRHRSKVAEIHRQLMLRGPAGPAAADEWAVLTRKNFDISVDDAAEHFSRYCTPSNVGKWANSLVGKRSSPPGSYVKRRVLEAFNQATWEQKVDAVYSAAAHDKTSDIPEFVWEADEFDSAVVAAIADSIVRLHQPDLLEKRRDGVKRSLQLLGLGQLAIATVKKWNETSSALSKAELDALLDLVIDDSPEAKRNSSDPSAVASAKPSVDPVAVILLRSRECQDLETYFSNFRQSSVSSDTLYLASALTYRPKWVALFENPIEMQIQNQRLTVDRLTGATDGRHIEVAFSSTGRSAVFRSAKIPLGAVKRTYSAGSVEHTALVMLDLFFSQKDNLETSHASGDTVVANRGLAAAGNIASSVYRLTRRPYWDPDNRTSRLMLPRNNSNRKSHDVRGHIRIVNGVEYPVRPHRRES